MTAPKFIVTERDYTAIAEEDVGAGTLLDTVGTVTKGVAVKTGARG